MINNILEFSAALQQVNYCPVRHKQKCETPYALFYDILEDIFLE